MGDHDETFLDVILEESIFEYAAQDQICPLFMLLHGLSVVLVFEIFFKQFMDDVSEDVDLLTIDQTLKECVLANQLNGKGLNQLSNLIISETTLQHSSQEYLLLVQYLVTDSFIELFVNHLAHHKIILEMVWIL